jgi:hypothetical protein
LKKPSWTSLLAVGLLMTGGMPVGAGEPVMNAGFEEGTSQSSENGTPSVTGWQFYRWESPGEIGSYGVSEEEASEGKLSAFVSAVPEGAVGWISKLIFLTDEMRQHLEIRVQVKKSRDYAGNTPWIFVGWHRQKAFLGRLDAALEKVPPGEWGVEVLNINPADIPDGSDGFQINLATMRGKIPGEFHGQLYFDDVKVTAGSAQNGN